MKKYFLLLQLIFVLCSCETEFSHTYIIDNSTSHKIKIKGYDRVGENSVLNDSTLISSEEILINEFDKFKVVKSAGYHSENQGVFSSSKYDSIIITFDKIKKITFSCRQPTIFECNGKYNLVNYVENFEKVKTGKSSGKDEFTYTFKISELDYLAADSIKD